MKKPILTQHAKDRMKQRKITMSNLEKVVKNPNKTLSQQDGNIKASRKLTNGRILAVIYKPLKDRVKIITTYYES